MSSCDEKKMKSTQQVYAQVKDPVHEMKNISCKIKQEIITYFVRDCNGQLNQSYISGEKWLEARKISLEQTFTDVNVRMKIE